MSEKRTSRGSQRERQGAVAQTTRNRIPVVAASFGCNGAAILNTTYTEAG